MILSQKVCIMLVSNHNTNKESEDDLLSLLLPDVHIPSFTPVADLASQMSDSAENVDANVDVKIED